jgi:hypothetical protein
MMTSFRFRDDMRINSLDALRAMRQRFESVDPPQLQADEGTSRSLAELSKAIEEWIYSIIHPKSSRSLRSASASDETASSKSISPIGRLDSLARASEMPQPMPQAMPTVILGAYVKIAKSKNKAKNPEIVAIKAGNLELVSTQQPRPKRRIQTTLLTPASGDTSASAITAEALTRSLNEIKLDGVSGEALSSPVKEERKLGDQEVGVRTPSIAELKPHLNALIESSNTTIGFSMQSSVISSRIPASRASSLTDDAFSPAEDLYECLGTLFALMIVHKQVSLRRFILMIIHCAHYIESNNKHSSDLSYPSPHQQHLISFIAELVLHSRHLMLKLGNNILRSLLKMEKVLVDKNNELQAFYEELHSIEDNLDSMDDLHYASTRNWKLDRLHRSDGDRNDMKTQVCLG